MTAVDYSRAIAYVFIVLHALMWILWCWRERAIREMRRIHAEQLASERRYSAFWKERSARALADLDVAHARLARGKWRPS